MKNKIGKIALLLAGIALACLAIGGMLVEWSGGWALRPGQSRIIEQERTFAGSDLTAIDLGTVEVDVFCHSGGGDRVQVRLFGRTNQAGEPPELFADLRGGIIELEVRPRHNRIMNLGFTQATLEVIVPDSLRFDLDVHTISGDVRLESLRLKKLDARTVSGDLQAREVAADATALRTTSGDFRVEGTPGDLDYTGVSGDLELSYQKYANSINLKSTSGEIRLDLPADSRFTLEAGSVSGDITSAFPIAITGAREQRHLEGMVGGGASRIKISTISGDIQLF